jgi:hypothetical protein
MYSQLYNSITVLLCVFVALPLCYSVTQYTIFPCWMKPAAIIRAQSFYFLDELFAQDNPVKH